MNGLSVHKIYTFVFLLFTICVIARFSAFLTVQISQIKLNLPFENLEEICMQSEYSICAAQTSSSYAIVKEIGKFDHILNSEKCKYISKSFNNRSLNTIYALCGSSNVLIFLISRDLYIYRKYFKRLFVALIHQIYLLLERN